jgi:hypothetical protein
MHDDEAWDLGLGGFGGTLVKLGGGTEGEESAVGFGWRGFMRLLGRRGWFRRRWFLGTAGPAGREAECGGKGSQKPGGKTHVGEKKSRNVESEKGKGGPGEAVVR